MSGLAARVLRLGLASLVLVAIAAQLITLAGNGRLDPVNFFSYFTIESNLIGVAVFIALALPGPGRRSAALDWWRGAAVVYLTVTFVVVIALLQDIDVGLQLVWVDVVLHKVFPIAIVADYLLAPPQTRLLLADGLRWLAYPLLWLAYTLLRGAVVGWYPYPFLDPANGGYGSVAVTSVIIVLAGAVLCAVVVWLGNARGRGIEVPLPGVS